MDSISLLQDELKSTHDTLEGTMADVTPEQAHWSPPGIANPVGATYAHLVLSEDMLINGILKRQAPFFASSWANRVGLSEMMPGPEAWNDYAAWTRRVRVDLPMLRQYAQAVYANTEQYLASLRPEDLDSQVDLAPMTEGQASIGHVLGVLVVGHADNISGEISCLKGLQGSKGYPF